MKLFYIFAMQYVYVLKLSSESQRTKYCLITSQLPQSAVLFWCFFQCLYAAFSIKCAHMATPRVVWYSAGFYHAYFVPLETQLGCLNFSFPGTFETVASQTDHAGALRYRKSFSRSSVLMSLSSTLEGKILLWSFVGGGSHVSHRSLGGVILFWRQAL